MLIENPLSVRVVPFKLAGAIAGLVPAIPIRMALPTKRDGRDKPGHDDTALSFRDGPQGRARKSRYLFRGLLLDSGFAR
jgi:hypothetical protein